MIVDGKIKHKTEAVITKYIMINDIFRHKSPTIAIITFLHISLITAVCYRAASKIAEHLLVHKNGIIVKHLAKVDIWLVNSIKVIAEMVLAARMLHQPLLLA
jgi:hypothetical protein